MCRKESETVAHLLINQCEATIRTVHYKFIWCYVRRLSIHLATKNDCLQDYISAVTDTKVDKQKREVMLVVHFVLRGIIDVPKYYEIEAKIDMHFLKEEVLLLDMEVD